MEGYNVNLSVMRKGAWTREEDDLLRQCIEILGEGKWHQVPYKAGLNRCRKSCRLRWLNYLKPNIKRGDFTEDEVDLIVRLHKLLGNRARVKPNCHTCSTWLCCPRVWLENSPHVKGRIGDESQIDEKRNLAFTYKWSLIAGRLPGRTSNDVKNYWNTRLRIDSRVKTMKNKFQETRKTIVIRPQPQKFIQSSYYLNSKEPILDHIQSADDLSAPSQTSSSTKKGNDWWETLLEDEDTFERIACPSLELEEEHFTSFWVDDMQQLSRSCVTFPEVGQSRGDFSFNMDLWNHSKEE